MLLDSAPTLEDVIVETLGRFPGVTVEQLQEQIRPKYGAYSISAIYQELRKLRERTVCSRIGKKYSLRMGWVLGLVSLSERMYSQQIKEIVTAVELPVAGKKQSWTFRNLKMLGKLWTHLLLALCEVSPDRKCFEWAPHAWFSLSHAAEEMQFIRAMNLASNKYFLIIGNDTSLSRAYTKELRDISGKVSFAESPFEGQELYYSLIGNFLITVEFSKRLAKKIDDLFSQEIQDHRVMTQQALAIFTEDSPTKLTIENSPAKLKKFQKQFSDYFGVKITTS